MTRKKVSGLITLRHVNVPNLLVQTYVKPNNQPVSIRGKHELPQTIIPLEDAEEEIYSLPELQHEKSDRCYYYLDSHKKKVKTWPNMIDVTLQGPLPATSSKPCWYCRHSFTTMPLGIPLRYCRPNSITEKHRIEEKFKLCNYSTESLDFFETEGLFCSFPCMKAYICDSRETVRYKDSPSLISMMHLMLFGVVVDLPRANPWKTLKDYQGHLTIEEYRETPGRLKYTETVNFRRPLLFCSSRYLTESKV